MRAQRVAIHKTLVSTHLARRCKCSCARDSPPSRVDRSRAAVWGRCCEPEFVRVVLGGWCRARLLCFMHSQTASANPRRQ
jgi:hypothetical protein